MNSERTRLSMAASDLIASIAGVLGASFEPLLPLFLPPLITLCGRTNKVIINHARSSIISIIQATQLPSFLQFFLQFIKDKSSSLRLIAAEGTLACLNCCNPPDLEKDTRASAIEAIIRGTARDANPEVRRLSKQMFSAYKILLPNRVERRVFNNLERKHYLFILYFAVSLHRSLQRCGSIWIFGVPQHSNNYP